MALSEDSKRGRKREKEPNRQSRLVDKDHRRERAKRRLERKGE